MLTGSGGASRERRTSRYDLAPASTWSWGCSFDRRVRAQAGCGNETLIRVGKRTRQTGGRQTERDRMRCLTAADQHRNEAGCDLIASLPGARPVSPEVEREAVEPVAGGGCPYFAPGSPDGSAPVNWSVRGCPGVQLSGRRVALRVAACRFGVVDRSHGAVTQPCREAAWLRRRMRLGDA